jgi:hypothetical protein
MGFRIEGLASELFRPLFDLPDDRLAAAGARRVTADSSPGYPCRVSLEDAEPGEELLLLHHEHQPAPSSHRASGPIYVRRTATKPFREVDRLPAVLLARPISLRGYDAEGTMRHCEVSEGEALRPAIERALARPDVEYLHLHNARPGCFVCRVDPSESA